MAAVCLLLATVPVQSDPSAADSLLPEKMSPGEKLMWGPNGLMRKVGNFPLTGEGRERELGLRRTLLTAHQLGGFATLGTMITTVVLGQMTLNGRDLGETHETFAFTTVGLYGLTAALSLISPPPLIRRDNWSSVSTHKALAWVHFTGMVLTPILGQMVADGGDDDVRRFHQVSAYTTTAAFAGAMLVITFR